jgi:heme exporter protein C
MKNSWWKILGVIVFIYVLIGGLLVPLRTGILSVYPINVKTGTEVSLSVTGYNSFYKSGGENKAWLRVRNNKLIEANAINPADETHLEATFIIPNSESDTTIREATLVIQNEKDGVSIFPSAVFISKGDQSSLAANANWMSGDQLGIVQNNEFRFPFRNILEETIRNTFFHVAIWMAMFTMLIIGLVYSLMYLKTSHFQYDRVASSITEVAVLLGVLGIVTGSFWAKYTWGKFWVSDVKLNMSAVAMLIYLAYLILRSSISDQDKRARVSAVYSVFAFVALIPLVFILPRMTDSLHPGNGGNPAFGSEDMENTLRTFFYPAILGFFLIGMWMANLLMRYKRVRDNYFLKENDIDI